MAGSLGTLAIELAANTARLTSDMGKAVNIVERGVGKMQSVFRGIASGAIIGGITALASRSIQIGDELNKAAIKAGIGGKAISELAFAAKLADVDINSLSTSLRFMQVNLSNAGSGAKEPTANLKALGLTFKDLQGLSADRQFEVIADRISKLKDPADRARAATELFGRAGANLLPLFEQGAEGIRKAREEAGRLGVSFTDEQIKRLADADDSIKRLKASWEGFATSLTSKAAPAISTVLDLLRGDANGVFGGGGSRTGTLEDQLRFAESRLELAKSGGYEPRIREMESEVNRLKMVINGADDFASRRARSLAAPAPPGFIAEKKEVDTLTAVIITASKIRKDAMADYYDSLNEMTQTDTERTVSRLNEIEAALMQLRDAGEISAEQFTERWQEALNELIPEVKVTANKVAKEAKAPLDYLSEYAKSAAQNMQSAFADFLFDPFKDGLKGLLKNFIDTIRRMVAEALAAKIFDSIKGSKSTSGALGFAKGLLGFANGGSFQVGGSGGTDSQLVAFKASPNETVSVTKPGQGGGMSFSPTFNIDARGAGAGVARELEGMLQATVYKAVDLARQAVRDDMSRGAFA